MDSNTLPCVHKKHPLHNYEGETYWISKIHASRKTQSFGKVSVETFHETCFYSPIFNDAYFPCGYRGFLWWVNPDLTLLHERKNRNSYVCRQPTAYVCAGLNFSKSFNLDHHVLTYLWKSFDHEFFVFICSNFSANLSVYSQKSKCLFVVLLRRYTPRYCVLPFIFCIVLCVWWVFD